MIPDDPSVRARRGSHLSATTHPSEGAGYVLDAVLQGDITTTLLRVVSTLHRRRVPLTHIELGDVAGTTSLSIRIACDPARMRTLARSLTHTVDVTDVRVTDVATGREQADEREALCA